MDKTEIAYLYVLKDPTTQIVRYVGKTIYPDKRLKNHISECKYKKVKHKRGNWIRSLLKKDLLPILEVIKVCRLDEFEKYETHYIKQYKSKYLTNSDETVQGNSRRIKEVLDRQSKNSGREVHQYSLKGEYIKTFQSVRKAAEEVGGNHGNITRCCNKQLKHAYGYIYSYEKKNIEEIQEVINPNAMKKQVVELDAEGNIINEWNSLMDCSRETGLDNGNISKVCNNKMKTHKSRIFRFKYLLDDLQTNI
jgi:hypothetical protein